MIHIMNHLHCLELFSLCLFNSHTVSDFLGCLWYNKTRIYIFSGNSQFIFSLDNIYALPLEIVGVSVKNELVIVLIDCKKNILI